MPQTKYQKRVKVLEEMYKQIKALLVKMDNGTLTKKKRVKLDTYIFELQKLEHAIYT